MCNMSGLRVEDGDTLNILVRSLPTEVRNYALMHSSGATYSSFKEAACMFENQHRLFKDFGAKRSLFGVIPEEVDLGQEEVENYPEAEASGYVNAVTGGDEGGPKCHKCGRRGHVQSACPTDLAKVKCYECCGVGHISANCKAAPTPEGKPTSQGKGSKGTSPGKGPSNRSQKEREAPKGRCLRFATTLELGGTLKPLRVHLLKRPLRNLLSPRHQQKSRSLFCVLF